MVEKKIKLNYFVLIISIANLFLYHLPIYNFTVKNLNSFGLDWFFTTISLGILIVSLFALIFYIILFLSNFIGKSLLVLSFNINALALYFINTYGVIIDKTMISNILNTNFEESSSFFSLTLIIYITLLGIIPSTLIIKTKIKSVKFKVFLKNIILKQLL
mgnify:FL=1